MKETGIVRRIDDLGRVVIPKSVRKDMGVREGDPLEIYQMGDCAVLRKYHEDSTPPVLEKTFFVLIEGNDPLIVTVKDDVNRPNNVDCHSVLEKWKTDNYGYTPYDYWEIDTCEKHNI